MSPQSDWVSDLMSGLCTAAVDSINARRFEWFDRHLADDFTATAHPFPNFGKGRTEFVEEGRKLSQLGFVDVEAGGIEVGSVILSYFTGVVAAMQHIEEDLGPGRPSAREIEAATMGRRLVYHSAWRPEQGVWKLFDHHLVVLS